MSSWEFGHRSYGGVGLARVVSLRQEGESRENVFIPWSSVERLLLNTATNHEGVTRSQIGIATRPSVPELKVLYWCEMPSEAEAHAAYAVLINLMGRQQ